MTSETKLKSVAETYRHLLGLKPSEAPCPVCGAPMQRVIASRPGYVDVYFACGSETCGYNQRRA